MGLAIAIPLEIKFPKSHGADLSVEYMEKIGPSSRRVTGIIHHMNSSLVALNLLLVTDQMDHKIAETIAFTEKALNELAPPRRLCLIDLSVLDRIFF